jgi:hypothetical protein
MASSLWLAIEGIYVMQYFNGQHQNISICLGKLYTQSSLLARKETTLLAILILVSETWSTKSKT